MNGSSVCACFSISATPSAMRLRPPAVIVPCCTARPSPHTSRQRSLVTAEAVRRIENLIRYFEPPALPALSAKRLLQAASGDKKNRAGVRRFVLLQGLGNAVVAEDVTDAEVLAGIAYIRRLPESSK